jgi:hypothetical protein
VNYTYAICFANATFAFANLARASNFPSVETAPATRVDPGGNACAVII